MKSTIRGAIPGDASAIQRVARGAWHAAYDPVLGPDRVDELVDSWYDPERLVADDIEQADRPFFVAVTDEVVVGFVEAVPDEEHDHLGHLYRIYVDPDYWDEGVGSRLLDRIESTLRENGVKQLQVSVMAANDVGIAFYESRGFRRTEKTHNEQLDIEEYEYEKPL